MANKKMTFKEYLGKDSSERVVARVKEALEEEDGFVIVGSSTNKGKAKITGAYRGFCSDCIMNQVGGLIESAVEAGLVLDPSGEHTEAHRS